MNIAGSSAWNETIRTWTAPLGIGLTLLVSVLIIVTTPPATGYELSLYAAYPDILWLIIALNIFFSIYAILRSDESTSNHGYYGYFSLLLIETVVLFLPVIRGYYSINRGSGDMFHHMFSASQILHSGYLTQTDFYPVMHIWLSFLYNFLPDYIILVLIFSLAFFIAYIFSLYILGKTLLGTRKGGIFVSIFGIPFIFSYGHYAFYPFLFALFIFPLILYAYQKIIHDPSQKSRFYICLIVLSFFIVFCHPMISVFLILMFSIFTVFELVKGWTTGRHTKTEAANIMVIVSLTLVLWWLKFRSVLGTLERISFAMLGQASHLSIIDSQMTSISTANISIVLVVERFIKTYGPVSLYFLISLVFLLYILYQYYRNRNVSEDDFIYSLQFCAALFIGIALITGYFVIFEPIRAAMYGLIFATILCGMFFYRIWTSARFKKWLPGLTASVIVIMTLVCMLTILALYSSPWTSLPNTALSYEDKSGNDWILDYQNAKIPVIKEESSNNGYAEYYFESRGYEDFPNLIDYTFIIPSGFGYPTNRTLGDSFAYLPYKKAYMMTTELMKQTPNALPADRRTRIKSFTDSDFDRLNNDPSVNLLYTNNDFGVWRVDIKP